MGRPAIAFPASDEEKRELEKYEFSDPNELGIRVYPEDERVVVVIYCRLTPGTNYDEFGEDGYIEFDDIEDEDEDEDEDEEVEAAVESDYLLNLLV